MPKIVDRDQRRTEVVEAVFRVTERSGLPHASLRNVAEEAGLVIGSVRHYFANQEELVVASAEVLSERILGRTAKLSGKLPETLAALAPTQRPKLRDAVLWQEFSTAARTDSAVKAVVDAHRARRVELVRAEFESLRATGSRFALDAEFETERALALVDGLTRSAALAELRPQQCEALITRHLGTLNAPAEAKPAPSYSLR